MKIVCGCYFNGYNYIKITTTYNSHSVVETFFFLYSIKITTCLKKACSKFLKNVSRYLQ